MRQIESLVDAVVPFPVGGAVRKLVNQSPDFRQHSTGLPCPASAETWSETTLNLLGIGVSLVDSRCEVVFSNNASMFKDSINCQLSGMNPLSRRLLQTQVRQGIESGTDSMVELFLDGKSHWIAIVSIRQTPSHRFAALIGGQSPEAPMWSLRAFAKWHRLTPTEFFVVQALQSGKDPQRIAADHGVSIATVRSQMQSVFGKTACRSQKNLVACLATLPRVAS